MITNVSAFVRKVFGFATSFAGRMLVTFCVAALVPVVVANGQSEKAIQAIDLLELSFSQPELAVENGALTPELLSAYIANTQVARLQNPALIQASALAFGQLQNPEPQQPALSQQVLSDYVSNAYVPTASRLLNVQQQRECLAQAVYHEARGEPEAGQWAVAAVILNRVQSSRYPTTVCGVVFQNASQYNRCQFSFACDGQSDSGGEGNRIVREAWVKANLIAHAAFDRFLGGKRLENLPDSVLFYHNRTVRPRWASAMQNVAEIGGHIFYSAL